MRPQSHVFGLDSNLDRSMTGVGTTTHITLFCAPYHPISSLIFSVDAVGHDPGMLSNFAIARRIPGGFPLCPRWSLFESRASAPIHAAFRGLHKSIRATGPDFRRTAATPCRLVLRHKSGQPDQVVGGAAENEQPAHLLQSPQLDLMQRAGLLQPVRCPFRPAICGSG
jgi:hypothetical protein